MTKKTAITILSVTLLIAIIFVSYFIFTSENPEVTDTIQAPEQTDDITFPIQTGISPEKDGGDKTPSTSSIPRLRQLSDAPIAGYTSFLRKSGNEATQDTTVFRYVDRATGNIFEITESSLAKIRVTNTTIPKIYEAMFFNSGDGVILRYLDEESRTETYVGSVVSSEEDAGENSLKKLEGTFLLNDISSITKSGTDNQFFYIKGSNGYTFTATTPKNQKLLLDSSVTEWATKWSGDTITLFTKPSGLSEGISFELKTSSGDIRKILDGKFGLISNPNNGNTKLLFSESSTGSIKTGVYDKSSQKEEPFPLSTLADKCVWSKQNENILYCAAPDSVPTGLYPDQWYQGVISFTDSLYKIDLGSNTVVKFEGIPSVFDVQDISLSDDEQFLLFQNKKDLMLWSLDLTK